LVFNYQLQITQLPITFGPQKHPAHSGYLISPKPNFPRRFSLLCHPQSRYLVIGDSNTFVRDGHFIAPQEGHSIDRLVKSGNNKDRSNHRVPLRTTLNLQTIDSRNLTFRGAGWHYSATKSFVFITGQRS